MLNIFYNCKLLIYIELNSLWLLKIMMFYFIEGGEGWKCIVLIGYKFDEIGLVVMVEWLWWLNVNLFEYLYIIV